MPGHLYFFRAPEYEGKIPEHQEAERHKLEDVTSVLRVALQDSDPKRFREFFYRALTMAQATFEPNGFNPTALNDLDHFKREVVQVAGPSIKWEIIRKLTNAVLIASAICLVIAFYGEHVLTLVAKNVAANDGSISVSLQNTALALATSFWGLLFASMTRNVDVTFETLLTPTADLMKPWFRLLFFGIPVVAILLLFQAKVVTISFGDKFSTALVADNAVGAIIVGLFLGAAERALPTEMENWSKRFLPSSKSST